MKIKFLRNTRDENGKERHSDFFTNERGEMVDWELLTFYTGVHAFDTGFPITFEEYYQNLLKQAIGGAYDYPPKIEIQKALFDLAVLIEFKYIKVILEEDLKNLQERSDQCATKPDKNELFFGSRVRELINSLSPPSMKSRVYL